MTSVPPEAIPADSWRPIEPPPPPPEEEEPVFPVELERIASELPLADNSNQRISSSPPEEREAVPADVRESSASPRRSRAAASVLDSKPRIRTDPPERASRLSWPVIIGIALMCLIIAAAIAVAVLGENKVERRRRLPSLADPTEEYPP